MKPQLFIFANGSFIPVLRLFFILHKANFYLHSTGLVWCLTRSEDDFTLRFLTSYGYSWSF